MRINSWKKPLSTTKIPEFFPCVREESNEWKKGMISALGGLKRMMMMMTMTTTMTTTTTTETSRDNKGVKKPTHLPSFDSFKAGLYFWMKYDSYCSMVWWPLLVLVILKKRRHWKVTFTTCCKMFMDALGVVLFVTYGSSVVTIAVSDWPFSLTDVV